jgi:hypothetical protein
MSQQINMPLELMKKETSCVTTNTLIRFAEHNNLSIEEYLKCISYSYEYLTNTKNWIIHRYTKQMYRQLNLMLNDDKGCFKAGLYSHLSFPIIARHSFCM